MNALFVWAAGWALVHSLWQGAITAVLLALVLSVTRLARVRYAEACAALCAMLVCFVTNLLREWPSSAATGRAGNVPGFAGWLPFGESSAFGSSPGDDLVPWLGLLWTLGVCAFCARHLAGWIGAHRLRTRGVCATDEDWQRRLKHLTERLRVTQPVQLLESCLVDAPIVLGHLRPVILLPAGLITGLPAAHIEAILAHELAHVRRHDYLVNFIQSLVEALLFYHPAVWWISSLIRTEREHCCDDLAVAVSGDAHQYASVLALLEVNRQPVPQPVLAATGGKSLVKRIERLLYPSRHPAGPGLPWAAVLVVMAGAALGLGAWPQEKVTPYTAWLNEDVVYIIQPAEREAFLKLTTDPERNMFIEQFWLRRGGDPVKQEHYRRIAYSNGRFNAPNTTGWKTDRGRIYIRFGPPDEIESHPARQGAKPPFEQWRYHHIPDVGDMVIVEFVDAQGNGNYRMTSDPHAKAANQEGDRLRVPRVLRPGAK